ncbi:Agamous-like MADS-box protein [Nymphaea thermarum]|nr:Agamous-like MADS-box protein [Nymphaea thermarum]
MGKRRISMGWISDRQRRHVTFSKRRKGLFKKAQELCCLTGATIGIICFSEAGNPFTFAYPPPADGKDGDDGHRRLLSIMQQHYSHSGTRLPVAESKSISEENNSGGLPPAAAGNDSLWASLQPLHGGGASASDPSRFDLGSSSGCVVEDEPGVGLQLQSIEEAETALLDSVPGQPMVEEQGLMDSRVSGSVSSSNYCDSSCLPPPLSPSIDALLSSPPSSFGWNDSLDILEMNTDSCFLVPSH